MKLIDLREPADDPNIVLKAALDAGMDDVVIVGNAGGEFFIAGSKRTIAQTVHLLSKAIHRLHLIEDAEDDD